MGKALTIHFIRNYTAEPIGQKIEEIASASGLSVRAEYGAYDNLGAELAALATASEPPEIVIVTIDLEYFSGGIFSPKWNNARTVADFSALLAAIDSIPVGPFILISTFIPVPGISLPWAPDHPVLGRDSMAFTLNQLVREFVAQRPNRCGLLDFERLAIRLGESATFDRRFGLMMKAPFKPGFVAAAAEEVLRYLRCRFLPPKKVLVLDCDNTLWGGVLGELGLEKIQLDPYEYPGIAYHRVQSEILSIAEKGFLICLCSKNDELLVWQALEQHPHCLIRRDKIAGHRINWTDKATNLKALALDLNLALESLVFVDDDPVECELIRSRFPEVSVIQVPSKIYEYPGILNASGFFDRISINEEDQQRAHFYQSETERRDLQKRHVDAEGFLRDLQMKATVRPLGEKDFARAAQLCQRTNQFNLTSKRYTEADLASFSARSDVKVFLLNAADRFGPLGQSGLIIFRKLDGDIAEVDSFLMSCRIIGRWLDRTLFCESLKAIRAAWPVRELRATFIPTARNKIVSSLWSDYGFSKISAAGQEDIYTCKPSELTVTSSEIIELVESL